MRRASEVEVLLNRITTLESRADALRTGGSWSSLDLRRIEEEHAVLVAELTKHLVRARLAGRPLEPVERGGADLLAQRRQKLHGRMLQQFGVWDSDHAAGRPLPPAHDAMKFSEAITKGA